MAFDPDAYLAKSGEFDPDEYLTRKRAREQFQREAVKSEDLRARDKFIDEEVAPLHSWLAHAEKKAKIDKDIARIKAEPDPTSAGEILRAAETGVGTSLSDVGDAASFGLFRKARNAVTRAVSPEAEREMVRAEDEYHRLPGAQYTKALANVIGYAAPVGLPGLVARGTRAAVGATRLGSMPIVGEAIEGALTGGTVAAGESAVRGENLSDVGAAGLRGLAMGSVAGATGGALTRAVGNAPERAAESELAGLAEGIRNKPRLTKYEPNEDAFRAELAQDPDLRALIKVDKRAAAPQVAAKVNQVAGADLDPIYERLTKAGFDKVPIQYAEKNLYAVRDSFDPFAEESQRAVVDSLIDKLRTTADVHGGFVPAQALRKAATAFQHQGHMNLPMLGPVPLSKEVKQGIGSALRASIGDHIESIAGNPATRQIFDDVGGAMKDPHLAATAQLPAFGTPEFLAMLEEEGAGKAAGLAPLYAPRTRPNAPMESSGKDLRQAFESANRRVSTWLTMKDLVDEAAKYEGGHATPAAEAVIAAAHALKHPYMTTLKLAAGDIPDKLTRNVLGPAVASRAGRALAPAGRAAVQVAPGIAGARGGQALFEAAQERKRKEEKLAKMIRGDAR